MKDSASLYWHCLLWSLMAIGGANAVTPDIHRYVVESMHWLDGSRFAELYAIAQAAPGPNVMFVALVGWNVAGLVGAVGALLALLLPSSLLTLGVARWGSQGAGARVAQRLRHGLAPLAIGLTLSTGVVLSRSAVHGWAEAGLTAAATVLVLRSRGNPLWLILGGALAGMVLGL